MVYLGPIRPMSPTDPNNQPAPHSSEGENLLAGYRDAARKTSPSSPYRKVVLNTVYNFAKLIGGLTTQIVVKTIVYDAREEQEIVDALMVSTNASDSDIMHSNAALKAGFDHWCQFKSVSIKPLKYMLADERSRTYQSLKSPFVFLRENLIANTQNIVSVTFELDERWSGLPVDEQGRSVR